MKSDSMSLKKDSPILLNLPLVLSFVFAAAHTHAYFNTADDVPAVQNPPYYDDSIIGIMEGFLGLNGAVFSPSVRCII